MARTVIKVPYTCSASDAEALAGGILGGDGYKYITIKTGEHVWKKGTGMASAMKYVKLEHEPGTLVISGWIQMGVGSVGGGDIALSGSMGMIPKNSVKRVIASIRESLINYSGAVTGGAAAGVVCTCGSVARAGAAFCPSCGGRLTPPAPVSAGAYCPACGAAIEPGAAFCTKCGARLEPPVTVCPSCGKEARAGAAFCSECGARIG